jgi:hypothetical protein
VPRWSSTFKPRKTLEGTANRFSPFARPPWIVAQLILKCFAQVKYPSNLAITCLRRSIVDAESTRITVNRLDHNVRSTPRKLILKCFAQLRIAASAVYPSPRNNDHAADHRQDVIEQLIQLGHCLWHVKAMEVLPDLLAVIGIHADTHPEALTVELLVNVSCCSSSAIVSEP